MSTVSSQVGVALFPSFLKYFSLFYLSRFSFYVNIHKILVSDVGNLKSPMFEEPSAEQALIKPPSVHEQEDGTIFAMCATGTSSRDSLLSWIRFLEADGNPALAEIPVIFKSRSPLGDVVPISGAESANVTEHVPGKEEQEH